MTVESILVTGSNGMVGTAVVNRLHDEGCEIYGVDRRTTRWQRPADERMLTVDLLDDDDVATLPTDVDLIVHLAANARVHRLVQNPRLAMENVEMTYNVLEFARRNEIPRVVFASSREVYGNSGRIVHDESESYTKRSESPYSASKVSGEALVTAYGECYDIRTCIVRLSNVYGRYDVSDRVVPLFIARAVRGRELTVYGAQKVLDFTYLDDCVDGFCRVVDQFPKAQNTMLNIASGRGHSLVNLAEEINELTPHDSDIAVEPSRTGEVTRYVADISKAEKILGYRPQHSLRDGLERTVAWYLDRPEILDQVRAHSPQPDRRYRENADPAEY